MKSALDIVNSHDIFRKDGKGWSQNAGISIIDLLRKSINGNVHNDHEAIMQFFRGIATAYSKTTVDHKFSRQLVHLDLEIKVSKSNRTVLPFRSPT